MTRLFLILPAFLIALSTPGFAQESTTASSVGLKYPTQKGNFMVGTHLLIGELGFGDFGQGHAVHVYNLGINPKAGYFITNNLLVGGSLSAEFYGNNMIGHAPYRTSTQSFGAGVFARRFFGKPIRSNGELNRMRFFLEAGASYNRSWEKYMTEQGTSETFIASNSKVSVTPGISYFITRNLAIEAGLTYTGTINSSCMLEPKNQIRFHVGLQIFLGKCQ